MTYWWEICHLMGMGIHYVYIQWIQWLLKAPFGSFPLHFAHLGSILGVMCNRKIAPTPLAPPTPMDYISSPLKLQLQGTPMD